MNKPFCLMMRPKKYYMFRRQTLNNWLDLHMHQYDEGLCYYCGHKPKDELWWYLPTCKGQAWHIRNHGRPGGPIAFGQHPKNTENPYYKRS